MIKKRRVFIGMSGGVDSSVGAALLRKRGYDVIGVHLKCYNVDGCAEADAEDARRAAETIGIPFYVFDFEDEYKRRVVEYMVDGYRRGSTPNPDVMCNREIKFGLFYERARELGADCIATGHYVRKARRGNRYFLKIAKDTNKDQSYFLWTLKHDQIKNSLFPVGDYLKAEVRNLARKFNLHNQNKKDSQGICFLGRVTLEEFLGDYLPKKKGSIVTTKGEKIGDHRGAHFYTIGQRHGLHLGMRKKGEAPAPHYVAAKDVKANTITVAKGSDSPELYQKEIRLTDIHFTDGKKYNGSVQARIRYRQPLSKAEFDGDTLAFEKPQKFVAAGQSAVFYDKSGILLGGGIIRK